MKKEFRLLNGWISGEFLIFVFLIRIGSINLENVNLNENSNKKSVPAIFAYSGRAVRPNGVAISVE